jgi:hypothetical protein
MQLIDSCFTEILSIISDEYTNNNIEKVSITIPKRHTYVHILYKDPHKVPYYHLNLPGPVIENHHDDNLARIHQKMLMDIFSALFPGIKITVDGYPDHVRGFRESNKDVIARFFSLLVSTWSSDYPILEYFSSGDHGFQKNEVVKVLCMLLEEMPDSITLNPYEYETNPFVAKLIDIEKSLSRVNYNLRTVERSLSSRNRAYLLAKYLDGHKTYAKGKGKSDSKLMEAIDAMDDTQVRLYELKNKSKLVKARLL